MFTRNVPECSEKSIPQSNRNVHRKFLNDSKTTLLNIKWKENRTKQLSRINNETFFFFRKLINLVSWVSSIMILTVDICLSRSKLYLDGSGGWRRPWRFGSWKFHRRLQSAASQNPEQPEQPAVFVVITTYKRRVKTWRICKPERSGKPFGVLYNQVVSPPPPAPRCSSTNLSFTHNSLRSYITRLHGRALVDGRGVYLL